MGRLDLSTSKGIIIIIGMILMPHTTKTCKGREFLASWPSGLSTSKGVGNLENIKHLLYSYIHLYSILENLFKPKRFCQI